MEEEVEEGEGGKYRSETDQSYHGNGDMDELQ